ncbi:MAG: glycosyltransferase [Microbacter sp.]
MDLKPTSLRILQLPSYFIPMGGEFCFDQSIALQDKGMNVSIVANVIIPFQSAFHFKQYPLHDFVRIEGGIPVYRHFQRNIPKTLKPNLTRWIHSTKRMVEAYIEKNGTPDLIHAHSWQFAGYVCSLLKEEYHIPYIITEHSGTLNPIAKQIDTLLANHWIADKLQKAYLHADAVIGVSQNVIDGIQSIIGNTTPTYVISNLIDTDFFTISPKKQAHLDFIFAAANSNLPEKAYDVLFKAFDIVFEQNQHVRLRIAGDKFHTKATLKILSTSHSFSHIEFLGWQQPQGIRALLWDADAFIVSSRVESQSIATLEAMSTGLPIVATEVIPTSMLTPQTGFRVPIDDPQQLADAMMKMINSAHTFDRQFIRSQAVALAHPEKVVSQIITVYNNILQHQT